MPKFTVEEVRERTLWGFCHTQLTRIKMMKATPEMLAALSEMMGFMVAVDSPAAPNFSPVVYQRLEQLKNALGQDIADQIKESPHG